MKRLPPALRPSYRYLTYNIHSEEKIDFELVVEAFWDCFIEYCGVSKLSEGEIWVMKNSFDFEEQKGVVKVEKDLEKDIISALTLVDSFNGEKGFVEVVNVSGSIKNI